MSRRKLLQRQLLTAFTVFALISIFGCASKAPPLEEIDTALFLQYKMHENQSLTYRVTEAVDQTMDIRGQSLKIKSSDLSEFTMLSQGVTEGNYSLRVTIDTIGMHITAPGRDLMADMSSAVAKSFDMNLSPSGKESNLEGAEEIKYTFENETRNISSKFQAFFPDLPDKPVRSGDSWTTKDNINEKASNGELTLYIESVNTLKGLMTIDGRKCLMVQTKVTGTLSGVANQQGAIIHSDGTIEGEDTWYFDYENGYFVKATSSGIANVSARVSGPEELTIPMKREYKIEIALVDRAGGED